MITYLNYCKEGIHKFNTKLNGRQQRTYYESTNTNLIPNITNSSNTEPTTATNAIGENVLEQEQEQETCSGINLEVNTVTNLSSDNLPFGLQVHDKAKQECYA